MICEFCDSFPKNDEDTCDGDYCGGMYCDEKLHFAFVCEEHPDQIEIRLKAFINEAWRLGISPDDAEYYFVKWVQLSSEERQSLLDKLYFAVDIRISGVRDCAQFLHAELYRGDRGDAFQEYFQTWDADHAEKSACDCERGVYGGDY